MNSYLVPANAKKGTLILNVFRPFDIILFGSGLAVTLIALAITQSSNTVVILLSLLPGLVTGLLVFPIPNYHNVLCALQSIIRFFTERRNYIWRGWCFYEKFAVDENTKK